MIIIHILTAIIFYFILMYISVNLMGYFIRGLFVNPDLDLFRLKEEGYSDEFMENSLAMRYKKNEPAAKRENIIMTTTAFILVIIYFYLLFRFWNIGVMAVAIMLMLGRFDGLMWEIKNGKKTNTRLMPKNIFYYLTGTLIIIALPALYYFLYHF